MSIYHKKSTSVEKNINLLRDLVFLSVEGVEEEDSHNKRIKKVFQDRNRVFGVCMDKSENYSDCEWLGDEAIKILKESNGLGRINIILLAVVSPKNKGPNFRILGYCNEHSQAYKAREIVRLYVDKENGILEVYHPDFENSSKPHFKKVAEVKYHNLLFELEEFEETIERYVEKFLREKYKEYSDCGIV
jgi:hypothetical protein